MSKICEKFCVRKKISVCGKKHEDKGVVSFSEKTHCRKTPTQEGGREKPAKTY
jgi:hypothetical protein